MDLARATLVLIRVLRTLINSIAKNLRKLQICLRFYSFYNKLDIQAILFDFFYFPINAPALTKPRGLRAPDAEVVGGSVAERNGERTGDGKTTGQKEGGGGRNPGKHDGRFPMESCRAARMEKKATPPKKRNGITSDYNFTAGIQSSLLQAIS